ncbi:aromatic amino acid lyase [Paracoccus sp. 12-3]|nr:aromatic amino acid lyase [Paracoccus xiamenensis]
MVETLIPGQMSLDTLGWVYWDAASVRLDNAAMPGIERAARRIAEAAAGEEPIYGVNTGFGKLASIRIAPADVAQLQRNLIISHC